MKTSRRSLLDTILNPAGLAATVRNNELRVQKIERAPVKFNFNKPNPPKKAPNAAVKGIIDQPDAPSPNYSWDVTIWTGDPLPDKAILFVTGSNVSTEDIFYLTGADFTDIGSLTDPGSMGNPTNAQAIWAHLLQNSSGLPNMITASGGTESAVQIVLTLGGIPVAIALDSIHFDSAVVGFGGDETLSNTWTLPTTGLAISSRGQRNANTAVIQLVGNPYGAFPGSSDPDWTSLGFGSSFWCDDERVFRTETATSVSYEEQYTSGSDRGNGLFALGSVVFKPA